MWGRVGPRGGGCTRCSLGLNHATPYRALVFPNFGPTCSGPGSFSPRSPQTTFQRGNWSWSRTRAP